MKELKTRELYPLRKKLHIEQNSVCPILKREFNVTDMVVDHQHKYKQSDENGVDGAGLIRGCIHNQANVVEGKISNSYVRYGLHKFISLPEYLRNLADYLDQENLPLIHPTERAKPKILMKSSYNELKKAYEGKAKFPVYRVDKKGRNKQQLTKPLNKLFEKYGIKPEFYP